MLDKDDPIAALQKARRLFEQGISLIDDYLRHLDSKASPEPTPAPPDDVTEFMQSCTVADDMAMPFRGLRLYDLHVAWCHVMGREVRSVTAFGRRVSALGYRKSRNGCVLYLGLKLSEVGQSIEEAARLTEGRGSRRLALNLERIALDAPTVQS